jgi:hypothetical protein
VAEGSSEVNDDNADPAPTDDQAIEAYWEHWRKQRADQVLDVVLQTKQPVDYPQWQIDEARRIKRKRRHDLIYSIVFYVVCGVAIVAFVLCILGAVR